MHSTRKYLAAVLLAIMAASLISCSPEKREKAFKRKLIEVAKEYISRQLRNPETHVLNDSTVMLGDSTRRYFIQPSQVHAGLIDDDDRMDGIVSVTSMSRTGGVMNEHLIILDTGGKLMMVRSVESDMKILSIRDRIITADLPTHPANNPLHNCPVCIVAVRYRFRNGDLEKTD